MTEFNISPSQKTMKEIKEVLNNAVSNLRDKELMKEYYNISVEMFPDMMIKEIKITTKEYKPK